MGSAALHPVEASALHARRERVFLILAGFFLGSMTMLNILGVSRFVDMSFSVGGVQIPFILAIGVLPYPLTFLCTDFISELYGKRRANFVVWVGLALNVWVMFILWVGGLLPPLPAMNPATNLPALNDYSFSFFRIRQLAMGAVVASMLAYLAAQFCDVYLFHFWKRLTNGKHLWLRNNGSTLVSQLVDSVSVIIITHFLVHGIPIHRDQPLWPQLLIYIGSSYVFKMVAALLDTIPFYVGVGFLSQYLQIDPMVEHEADREEVIEM